MCGRLLFYLRTSPKTQIKPLLPCGLAGSSKLKLDDNPGRQTQFTNSQTLSRAERFINSSELISSAAESLQLQTQSDCCGESRLTSLLVVIVDQHKNTNSNSIATTLENSSVKSTLLTLRLESSMATNTSPSPQPDLQRNRLPTLFEVLSRRTLPPVDLFSFYIYMRDQQRSVDYLDFWDVN